jgi:hypothetical protein
VNVRRQSLIPGHRGEQAAQGAVLRRVKGGSESMLVFARELGNLAQQPFSSRREVKGVQPAIVGVTATLQIATLLELVDIYNDAAGQHTQLSAESLLAATGLAGDRAQYSRVWRRQLYRGHLLGEQRRRVMAELGQQEGHSVGVVAGWG